MTAMFVNSMNADGTVAGVFEADEDVSYFYLYKLNNRPKEKIIGAIQIFSGRPDFTEEEVEIRWSSNESFLGLFIKGKLWAYFELPSGRASSGHYPAEPLSWPKASAILQ